MSRDIFVFKSTIITISTGHPNQLQDIFIFQMYHHYHTYSVPNPLQDIQVLFKSFIPMHLLRRNSHTHFRIYDDAHLKTFHIIASKCVIGL